MPWPDAVLAYPDTSCCPAQGEEAAACRALAEGAAAAAAALKPVQFPDATGQALLSQLPVPEDISGILTELASIEAARSHMQHVQVWCFCRWQLRHMPVELFSTAWRLFGSARVLLEAICMSNSSKSCL